MKHHKHIFVLSVLGLVAIGNTACVDPSLRSASHGFSSRSKDVITDELVGLSEQHIRKVFGVPESDEAGYQSLGLRVPESLPAGPIRTLIFRHGEGTLWAWVVQRKGQWVCFESCWFADGVQF